MNDSFLQSDDESKEKARINLVIPSDLNQELREAVFQRRGLNKGDISEAICEGIRAWIDADVLEPLEAKLKNEKFSNSERQEAAYSMAKLGYKSGSRSVAHSLYQASNDETLESVTRIIVQTWGNQVLAKQIPISPHPPVRLPAKDSCSC